MRPIPFAFQLILDREGDHCFLLLFSVPSRPPSNVKAVSNTPSSITVSWDQIPGNGQNGVIQGYVVFYRDQSSSSWTESDVKLDYSLELTNLVTGKPYTVCVAGYTKVGRGVKSPEIRNIVVGGKIYFLCKKGPVKLYQTHSPRFYDADKNVIYDWIHYYSAAKRQKFTNLG